MTTTIRRRWPTCPDRWTLYPDPARYLAIPTLYGLTVDQYRAEWYRRQAEGWQRYELELRFPAPAAWPA
ncbi:MAG TPA: hypothetical protein VFE45_10465 [Coriobacteriia bacterium]|nr:hypothetical protein [Coriobacteriia bacterium]